MSFSQIPYKTVIERSQWQEKVCLHNLSPLICCYIITTNILRWFPQNVWAIKAKIKWAKNPRDLVIFWIQLRRTYQTFSSQADPTLNLNIRLGYRHVCHLFVLITFWRHLWSITKQMHSDMESICESSGELEKAVETLTYGSTVFPQHFSFSQTSTCISITW